VYSVTIWDYIYRSVHAACRLHGPSYSQWEWDTYGSLFHCSSPCHWFVHAPWFVGTSPVRQTACSLVPFLIASVERQLRITTAVRHGDHLLPLYGIPGFVGFVVAWRLKQRAYQIIRGVRLQSFILVWVQRRDLADARLLVKYRDKESVQRQLRVEYVQSCVAAGFWNVQSTRSYFVCTAKSLDIEQFFIILKFAVLVICFQWCYWTFIVLIVYLYVCWAGLVVVSHIPTLYIFMVRFKWKK